MENLKAEAVKFDLEKTSLREVNQFLHGDAATLNGKSFSIETRMARTALQLD